MPKFDDQGGGRWVQEGLYVEDLDTDGAIGEVPTSDGANGLVMQPSGASATQLNGIVDPSTATTASWTDSTPDRTFSIQPTGASFTFYSDGKRYTSTGDTKQIAATEGTHFIYYDENGTIQETTTFTTDLITKYCILAVVYWDNTNSKQIMFNREHFHSVLMSGGTHGYLHDTIGFALESGGGLSSIVVDDTGDLDAHAQFGNDATVAYDEDAEFSHSARGSTATIPVYYRSGADASDIWRVDETASFGVLTTGTGRAAWNELTGGNWQQTEVTNNQFVLAHVAVTNDTDRPFVVFQGQSDYSTLINARDGAVTEINSLITNGLPSPEWRFVGTIIYQTSNGYGNTVKSRIRSTDSGDDYVDLRGEFIGRGGFAGPGTLPMGAVTAAILGTPTYDTLKDWYDITQSAGRITGGAVTDNGDGTVAVTAGTGIVKSTNSPTGENLFFDWTADASVGPLSDNALNFIYVDYNSGTPIIGSSVPPAPIDGTTQILLTTAYRKGTKIWVNDVGQDIANMVATLIQRLGSVDGVVRTSGAIVSETGTRYLDVTAGIGWNALEQWISSAFDTSVGDTFDLWYRDGVGGFTRSTAAAPRQVDNTLYDDGSGTPASLGNNKFAIRWVFITPDSADTLHVVYGRNEYNSEAEARSETFPTDLPDLFSYMSVLAARIIVQEGTTNFVAVDILYDTDVGYTPVSVHNDLGGLQGGTTDEYYHLTAARHTDLTDGGDSTLHYHATDRARANHTGTQTKSTISDFAHASDHSDGGSDEITVEDLATDGAEGTVLTGAGGGALQMRALKQSTLTPTGTTQTIDWDDGLSVEVDLESATGDVTLTLNNPVAGETYMIKFIQDSGGTFRDVVLPSTVLVPGGSAPSTLNITEVNDAIDMLVLYYDGTNYLANFTQNYG